MLCSDSNRHPLRWWSRHTSSLYYSILLRPIMPVISTQNTSGTSHSSGRASVKKSNRHLETENLRRQKKTLILKLDKMSKRFGLDICLQIRGRGKQDLYTTDNNLSWPHGIRDVKVSRAEHEIPSTYLLQEKSYPIPRVLTPASIEKHERRCDKPNKYPSQG